MSLYPYTAPPETGWIEDAPEDDCYDFVACNHPLCTEPAVAACDCCDTHHFCGEHGTEGGDRNDVAVPNACWSCGGFSVDEV